MRGDQLIEIRLAAVVEFTVGGKLPRPFQAEGVQRFIEANGGAALLLAKGVDLFQSVGTKGI